MKALPGSSAAVGALSGTLPAANSHSRWWQYWHFLGARGGWIHILGGFCSFCFQSHKLKKVVTNLSPFLLSPCLSVFLFLFLFFPGVGIFCFHPLAFCSSLLLHPNALFPLTSKSCLVLCLSTFQGELLFLLLTSAHNPSPLLFLPVSYTCTASDFMWHFNTVNIGSYSVLSKTVVSQPLWTGY